MANWFSNVLAMFSGFVEDKILAPASKQSKPVTEEPKTLATVAGVEVREYPNGMLEFTAGAAIDADGSDNRHGDPYWQPQTTLRQNGRYIDAEAVPYGVLPPQIIRAVAGIVLGCRMRMSNLKTGQWCDGVMVDVGPKKKIGELSCEAARRLGLSGNPNHGGTSEKIIRYQIWPGVPAVVDGVHYNLQKYGA